SSRPFLRPDPSPQSPSSGTSLYIQSFPLADRGDLESAVETLLHSYSKEDARIETRPTRKRCWRMAGAARCFSVWPYFAGESSQREETLAVALAPAEGPESLADPIALRLS